jgi:hypothetical protein
MRELAWDTSFRRAFKRHTRNNPALQNRISHNLANPGSLCYSLEAIQGSFLEGKEEK